MPSSYRASPRRRRSVPNVKTPFSSSYGGEGSTLSRSIGSWWPGSSLSSSTSGGGVVGGRRHCGFSSMNEAFFESYGVLEDGGQVGVRLAARQLATGVRVLCTMGRAVNSCTVSITYAEHQTFGEYRGDFIRIMGVHSTLDGYVLVPLTDVAGVVCEPRGPRGTVTCEIRKQRGGGSKVFSVVCLDRNGKPAASLTKAVALVLAWNASVVLEMKDDAIGLSCAVNPADVWETFGAVSSKRTVDNDQAVRNNDQAVRNNDHAAGSNDHGSGIRRNGGQFASVLEPAGLLIEYGDDFEHSGLEFQDLAVVDRQDLEEIVGITDRLHQIKIMTQIRLRFHGAGSEQATGDGGSELGSSGSSSSPHYVASAIAGPATTPPQWQDIEQEDFSPKFPSSVDLEGHGSADKNYSESRRLL